MVLEPKAIFSENSANFSDSHNIEETIKNSETSDIISLAIVKRAPLN